MDPLAAAGADGHSVDPRDGGGPRPIEALGRNWPLVALIVVPLTAIVLVVSLLLPATYRTSATIALTNVGVTRAGGNPELVLRKLETVERLATTNSQLTRAAAALRGETAQSLDEKLSASADPEANLVRVSAEDGRASTAARIANAVATAVVAGSRGELTVVDRARPADRPRSPRPLQNTLFAFFGFLFIGVLAALGKEQLSRRIRSARELAAHVGSPILVELPLRLHRAGTAGRTTLDDVYEPVRETVGGLLPVRRVRTLAVVGAGREPEPAEVAAALAEAFARGGESVALVVASGTRGTRPQPPAVSDLVGAAAAGRDEAEEEILVRAERSEGLMVLERDAKTELASRRSLGELIDVLAKREVGLIVVSGNPLLSSSDGLLLAGFVDAVVLVCVLGRTRRDDAERLHDLIRASGANVVGIVAIGGDLLVPHRTPSRVPAVPT